MKADWLASFLVSLRFTDVLITIGRFYSATLQHHQHQVYKDGEGSLFQVFLCKPKD